MLNIERYKHFIIQNPEKKEFYNEKIEAERRQIDFILEVHIMNWLNYVEARGFYDEAFKHYDMILTPTP